MHDDIAKENRSTVLHRLSELNQPNNAGPGLPEDHTIPLCQFHNRELAMQLCQRLDQANVRAFMRPTRMFTHVEVALADRQTAYTILQQFRLEHDDTPLRKFSRDYDGVLLIALATGVCCIVAHQMPGMPAWAPLAFLTSGISLSIVFERIHRNYRYHSGAKLTLTELMILIALFAINLSVWRFVYM